MKLLPLACLLTVSLVALWPTVRAGTEPLPTASRDKAGLLQARLDFAEQYYRYPELIKDTLVPPRWLRTGEHFVYWAATGPHRGTWVLIDARTGTGKPLITPADLRLQLGQLAGRPAATPDNLFFAIAPDQQRIVFKYQEHAYTLGLSEHRIMALASTDPLASSVSRDMDNIRSPDGLATAVQRENGFAIFDDKGHALLERNNEEKQDWQIPKNAWSPDGRKLLVWRNDNHAVHTIPIVDYSDAVEKVSMVPYAKVGTPLPHRTLYVVEPATQRVTPLTSPEGETYSWLAGWRPDGREALILHLSRDGKRLDLSAVDPRNGKTRLVVRDERLRSFVGGLDLDIDDGWALQVVPLEDNRHFVWMSERDGWRHAYLYDYSGQLVRQVTKGDFPVHQVIGTTGKNAILVLASAEKNAPYDRLLYRVSLDGGPLQRLTSDPGLHRIYPSPSGRYYVDAHSTRAQPRAWDVNAVDGTTSFRYAEADTSALSQIHYAPPEAITVLAADGVTPLYGVLYKPWDFDPRKRYPVIDRIYGGPFTTVVPWGFVGISEETRVAGALAQMGFIVMVLDARGTPGRGKVFQDATYGRIGQLEIPDHVAALRQAVTTRPYMDMDRVGIYGHSWGGYFALRGMLTAPDFFKAGYAGAPGELEEESIINEPYLGLRNKNPDGYRAGSNLLIAANLCGVLRIMHGTSDVNAPLSTTMRVVDALIHANKRFELLIMPGQPHSPADPARRYYHDDVRMFFLRTLGDTAQDEH
jgi:dipeptidyl aminopeptidase/acylaminoacyl peptidase